MQATEVLCLKSQLSMVGCPVWSILLNMSIPNAESDELNVRQQSILLVKLRLNMSMITR
ncbi:hypothetical protein Hanom_Chr07g00647421 [Helianthus anomalus]